MSPLFLFQYTFPFSEANTKILLYTQLFCFVPVIVYAVYAISQCVDFFVHVMGRLGNAINPEFVMGPLSLVIASSLILFVVRPYFMDFIDGILRITCSTSRAR